MRIHRSVLALLFSITVISTASAQTTQPQGELLGAPFKSVSAGISVSPPFGTTLTRGAVGGAEIARFTDDRKKWVFKVSRVVLEPNKPIPLSIWKDDKGKDQPGMLALAAEQIKIEIPGAQELRRDITTINGIEVGMVATKFSFGLETNLTQQAIFHASDLQYYILAMVTPAPRGDEIENDPGVQSAVTTFASVLNSVKLLDQSELMLERDDRLRLTRALYLNLTEAKLRNTIQRGQWLRVIRGGKDVGFTYVVEEIARDLPRKGQTELHSGPEGVLVGLRSRMLGDNGGQIDSESWFFSTFDRKIEAFSTTIYTDTPQTGKMITGDVGSSRWRERPVAVAARIGAAKAEPDLGVEYKLEVNKLGRNALPDPIVRDLPPYYLPQALGHLLPRLVEGREPRKYLFASWSPEISQVIYRYVDVLPQTDANLNGKRVRAIPVEDRMGLEGSVTTHYISPEGQYLGSVNPDTKTTVVASDSQTLEKIWRDANLTRPGAVEGR